MDALRSTALISLVSAGLGLAVGCADGDSLSVGGAGGELATQASTTHATTQVASTTTVASTTVSTVSTVASTTGTGLPMCQDPGPGEPGNDTQAGAYSFGEINDSDDQGGQVNAILGQGGDDVDWYTFHGVDAALNVVDPTRQVQGGAARACIYVDCDDNDDEDFSCPGGTTADTQGGNPGCCWTGGASVSLNLVCGSTSLDSDDATIWLRVDHPGGPGCEAYQLNYHY